MKHRKGFVPDRFIGPGKKVDGAGNVLPDPVVKRRCSVCLLSDIECVEHKEPTSDSVKESEEPAEIE